MSEGRFLDSDVPSPQFEALGHSGSDTYVGIETFPNPGCGASYTSDEVMAICPITKQPDFYTIEIQVGREVPTLPESKSLKLFFQNLMVQSIKNNQGIFCESLAVHVKTVLAGTLGAEEGDVRVVLTQKSRGGIVIRAFA